MRASFRIRWFALLVLAGAAGGCRDAESAVVEGSVLLDGQPLAGAEVQFLPRGDIHLGAHTVTADATGHFTVKADARNNPVKPGIYTIVVNKRKRNPAAPNQRGGGMAAMLNEVPAVYQYRNWTPLAVEVRPGNNQLPPLELTSHWRN